MGLVDGLSVRFVYSSMTFTPCWLAILVSKKVRKLLLQVKVRGRILQSLVSIFRREILVRHRNCEIMWILSAGSCYLATKQKLLPDSHAQENGMELNFHEKITALYSV